MFVRTEFVVLVVIEGIHNNDVSTRNAESIPNVPFLPTSPSEEKKGQYMRKIRSEKNQIL